MKFSPCFSLWSSAILRLLPDSADLGRPALAGSVEYDAHAQSYRVVGAGANMWGVTDEAHFVSRPVGGDVALRAQAAFVRPGGHAHRKFGLSLRGSGEGDAAHVSAVVHADGLTSLQFRRAPGGKTEELVAPVLGADVLQLERSGRAYTLKAARFGEPWVEVTLADGPDLGPGVLAGLFVCSHDAEASEEAVFHNVRLFRVAPPELRPYRDFLPSDLELLDPETGHARIVHRAEGELQAPNWTPDGSGIDLNRAGRIHRLELATGALREIDTGFATRNNNDHVLSPDGRWIGLSHHAADQGGRSLVYIAPASGGEPRLVTPTGPSYLLGWSPDGSQLLYIAQRPETGSALNIYRAPVAGGVEERLSHGPSLDDGAEYSPGGKWIYFNSDRSGQMKIWRMRPDGSGTEKLTDDGLNDWFPHVAPDGRSVAFISYGPEVPAREHPFYRHVYLRRFALTAGGEVAGPARIIAYVYGGQGSFNVPSWSPDGAAVAFVSNGGLW
jgi:Tol biopolymer transport system component